VRDDYQGIMARQQTFDFPNTHGGRREGAGRKPKIPGRPGSPHKRRPAVDPRHPQHVTLRVRLTNLRRRHVWQALAYALAITARRTNFRICHVSIQRNHVHLICEAADHMALARGLQGFQISCAKQINARLERTGQVFSDRYHARALTNPTMVKHAIRYVLNNARHHGERFAGAHDPFSTAKQFPGWREAQPLVRGPFLPVKLPRTFLLAESWKKLARPSAYDIPG
jgi:REP element-mobilizing transposase RayT